jgi:excinuclease ABC subunit C
MTLEEKLRNLPDRPGVYLMKNAKGRVIYVGKARSLRSRVRSYFQKGFEPDPRKVSMVGQIKDLETVVTASELEAFILESNLIKKHKPRYNIILRDDKNYPYLKLTVYEDFPALCVVRKVEKDGALYFGPYVPAGPMWETYKFISRSFPLRKCRKTGVGSKVERPCLQHGMGRCSGACGGRITKEEYAKIVEEVRLFLSGKDRELIRRLEKRMGAASDAMDFEAAAGIRDRIAALRNATSMQRVVSSKLEDRDVIAAVKEGAAADVQIMFVRAGKLLGRKDFYLKDTLEIDEAGILTNFINQFYDDAREVPPEVLVSHPLGEAELVCGMLAKRRSKTVELAVPQRGAKAKLIDMALDNARETLSQNLKTDAGRELVLMSLKAELGLRRLPRSIEAFDISNIGGREAVGSMVSFLDARPDKSGYRHFRIKEVEGSNDFAMMAEVISRRYRRVMEEGGDWPDLIMIDGGKGQLSAAIAAIRELGVDVGDIDIVGLAKAREKGMKYAGVRETSAFERVYSPDDSVPKVLPPTSAAVNLLAQVRDESHRFAITHHRKLRAKKAAKSPLDDIPGVGRKRKMQLLKHFGSFRAVREATLDELKAVKGMPDSVADAVYEVVHVSDKAVS